MSETFECQRLPPFRACGLVGSCEINETQAFCECEAGWQRSEEMILFYLSEDEVSQGLGICNFNRAILLLLYILVLFFGLLALLLVVLQITTRSKLKRQTPLLIGLGAHVAVALYRLLNLDDTLFGKDVLFTFVIANTAFVDWIAINIYLNKYFQYIARKGAFAVVESNEMFRKYQVTNIIGLCVEFIAYQMCWISIVAPDQDKTGRILLKSAFGVLALTILYYVWSINILFDAFIKDLRSIVNLAERRDKKIVSVPLDQQNTEVYIKDVLLPHTVRLRNQSVPGVFAFALVLFLCALWDYIFVFYGYLFPLNMIIWCMPNISIAWYSLRKSKRKKRFLMTSSTPEIINT